MPNNYFTRIYRGEPKRLSKALALLYPDLSYRILEGLLDRRDVFVDGVRAEKNALIADGQSVSLYITPSLLRIRTIYQNENILLLYKPKGIESDGEMSFAGLARFCFGDVMLMHRLDTNTDGLLLFAKTQQAYDVLYRAMKEGRIIKYYRALVYGEMHPCELQGYLFKDSKEGRVYIADEPSRGAVKVTCRVVNSLFQNGVSQIEIELHGGKTHQLRAQLAHSGHFILGDGKYGDDRINRTMGYKKQQLTAYRMVFCLPDNILGLEVTDVSM